MPLLLRGVKRSKLKNKVRNENKKILLVPIKERNIENINEILTKYVQKGTTIYIDRWKWFTAVFK